MHMQAASRALSLHNVDHTAAAGAIIATVWVRDTTKPIDDQWFEEVGVFEAEEDGLVDRRAVNRFLGY